MRNIVIIGASSGIGRCLAEIYSKEGATIVITGRREEKLVEVKEICGGKCYTKVFDVTAIDSLHNTLNEIYELLGSIDLMIISSGTGELNPELKYELEKPTLDTNIIGWTCIVDWTMNQFEKQGFGHLVSISSVGGLRGSGVAPAYNASKAFQMNYMEGMLQKANKIGKKVFVTDIRPGFVDTAMAKGDGLFWVAPVEKTGKQIYTAIKKRKSIAYITKRWRFIAFILKHIPSFVYSKM
ncbi:MAG: SDR family NAD(P)-dependent oxidoreductase [Marinifilaceae bacterium]